MRVEIAVRQYNPNPLMPRHGQHSPAEGKQRFSSCPTASEIKFREAVRPPFSKGDEYWGAVRRRRGKAPYPLGERKGAFDAQCQKCFCVTFEKSNKTSASPDTNRKKGECNEAHDKCHAR